MSGGVSLVVLVSAAVILHVSGVEEALTMSVLNVYIVVVPPVVRRGSVVEVVEILSVAVVLSVTVASVVVVSVDIILSVVAVVSVDIILSVVAVV